MNRIALYAGLGLAAFAGFAAALTPARLAFDLAARPAGLEAGIVAGPVWNAALRRVRLGDVVLADVEARLQAAPLLAGRAVVDWTVRDPAVRGAGRLSLSSGAIVVENAEAVIGLDALPALAAANLPAGESARVVIDRLELDRDGRCVSAEGQVSSTALVTAGAPFGAELPPLDAALGCAGGAVALNFAGRTEQVALSGQLRLTPPAPQWRIVAETGDRDMIAALSMMGFSQEGGRFVAESTP